MPRPRHPRKSKRSPPPVSDQTVVIGPQKVEAGCPPPDVYVVPDGTTPPRSDDRICVSNLVNALADIESWIADIRKALDCLPPDACIECPKGSTGTLVMPDRKRKK